MSCMKVTYLDMIENTKLPSRGPLLSYTSQLSQLAELITYSLPHSNVCVYYKNKLHVGLLATFAAKPSLLYRPQRQSAPSFLGQKCK